MGRASSWLAVELAVVTVAADNDEPDGGVVRLAVVHVLLAKTVAVAATGIVRETVEPAEGDVMLIVGGEVAWKTLAVTGLEVVVFPPPSRARAVRVWEPLLAPVVFQETE